jgi:hypothetical protein
MSKFVSLFAGCLALLSMLLVGCAVPPEAPMDLSADPSPSQAASTATSIPPTATAMPATATAGAATSTVAAPTNTPAPSAPTVAVPTNTPVPPTPTPEPKPTWVADGVVGEGEYTHIAEAAGVTLHWTNDTQFFYGALEAATSGWIAVGFDPEVRMKGANFVFGYVQGGQTFIEDMFGVQEFGPGAHPTDEELGGTKDIVEFGGQEDGGRTVIEFKIPLDSGDAYDKPLASGSTYTVILAVGSSDDFQEYHANRDYTEVSID